MLPGLRGRSGGLVFAWCLESRDTRCGWFLLKLAKWHLPDSGGLVSERDNKDK